MTCNRTFATTIIITYHLSVVLEYTSYLPKKERKSVTMVLPCCNKRNVESSVIIAEEERQRLRSCNTNESKGNSSNDKGGTQKNIDRHNKKQQPRQHQATKDNLKSKSNNNNTSSTRISRPVPDSREEDTTEDDDAWMEDVWLGRASIISKAAEPHVDNNNLGRRLLPPQEEEEAVEDFQRQRRRKDSGSLNTTDSQNQQDVTKPKTAKKKNNKGVAKKSSSSSQDGVPSSPTKHNDKAKAKSAVVKSKSIPVSPRNMGRRRMENGNLQNHHHHDQKEGGTCVKSTDTRSLTTTKNNDQIKIDNDDDAPTTVIGPSKSTIQQQQQQRSSSLWEEVFDEQQAIYRRQSELHEHQHQNLQYDPNNHRHSSSVVVEQQKQKQSQLSKSIVSTFQELSKERPDQMEEEAIQRAMELSMLDVALVYYDNNNNNNNNNNKPGVESKSSSTSNSWFSSSSSIMSNALTISKQQQNINGNNQLPSPYKILGISPNNATPDVIKAAYRKLARMHHPDKGGDSNKFQVIACAYRSLLSGKHNNNNNDDNDNNNNDKVKHNLKGTAHWDKQLQDHRKLVQELFQANGINIDNLVTKQLTVLEMLALINYDAGSTNRNESNELIRNSCFYLSLAASYLWGIGAICYYDNDDNTNNIEYSAESTSYYGRNNRSDKVNNNNNNMIMNEEDVLLVGETALQLKRTIEAAVVKAHPEWAVQGMVGEEVQAFSDFLVYTLDSQTLLSDWAVIVFDACSGYCDVYKGRNYINNTQKKKYNGYFSNTTKDDEKWAQTNTITLRYIPGHYQPLIPSNKDAQRPSLETILSALDDAGVFYVVTDGNS